MLLMCGATVRWLVEVEGLTNLESGDVVVGASGAGSCCAGCWIGEVERWW